MEYVYDDFQPGVQIFQSQGQRPRGRGRQGSERARHHDGTYWAGETLLVPAAGGYPLQRSASTGGQRPTNIVIRNELDANQDNRSRSRDRRGTSHTRRRSHSKYESESSSESDWDEREHERRRRDRHRRHSSRHDDSRSPSVDWRTKQKLKQLEDYEREKEREKQEKEIKQAMLLKKAKEDMEEAERKKREEELRKRAIADYEREQAAKELKAKKEKEEADRLFEQKVKAKFLAAGYSEEDAQRILDGKKKDKQHKEMGLIADTTKTTFVKVHRKYLLPETLDAHYLPWEWDERDGNYIIIKRWINKDLQDDLFEHTRKIKERKLIAYETPKEQEDKLYIVRKKSKSPAGPRRSWMFT